MFEGCKVDLKMEKTVMISSLLDESPHVCKVLRYDPEEDYITFTLELETLSSIQLDAKYRCDITTKSEVITCSGVVKERFSDEKGNVLIFKIENGFYSNKK